MRRRVPVALAPQSKMRVVGLTRPLLSRTIGSGVVPIAARLNQCGTECELILQSIVGRQYRWGMNVRFTEPSLPVSERWRSPVEASPPTAS